MLIFTAHVKDRMRERGVSADSVKKTIESPEYIRRELGESVLVRKKILSKTVEVIYVVKDGNKIVLTCYYL